MGVEKVSTSAMFASNYDKKFTSFSDATEGGKDRGFLL